MKYTFIKNHEYLFPIEKMCKVLEVGSSGYYKWKNKPISNRTVRKNQIKQQITEIYFDSKQRYGSPRITTELNALGYKISRITVAKYMKELGLRSKLSKKFKVTTDSKHNYLVVDNVLDRDFAVAHPSRVWVSDITYIQTKEGFLYLTTIIDLYDRKMIGWSLSNGMSTDETTLAAWKMAIRNRSVQKGLIFHSDRGIQYANKKFANTIESYGIIRSMSRKGNCWDNAIIENFFGTLKSELFYLKKFDSIEQLKKEIKQYIYYYNKVRTKSNLNKMSPIEYRTHFYNN